MSKMPENPIPVTVPVLPIEPENRDERYALFVKTTADLRLKYNTSNGVSIGTILSLGEQWGPDVVKRALDEGFIAYIG